MQKPTKGAFPGVKATALSMVSIGNGRIYWKIIIRNNTKKIH
jgi:hypothetical protein